MNIEEEIQKILIKIRTGKEVTVGDDTIIETLLTDYEKEKEKNKKLENDLKDKIIKMLQELEDRRNKQPVIGYWSKKAMLEKLLKEE